MSQFSGDVEIGRTHSGFSPSRDPSSRGARRGTIRPTLGCQDFSCDLDLLGVPTRVEVSGGLTAERVRLLLTGMPRASVKPKRFLRLATRTGSPGELTLSDDGQVLRDRLTPARAVAILLWQLNQVALSTPNCLVLHAGCVSRSHRALVLSGPMDAGKSTLVAGLVRRGLDYLSDEFAPLSLADGSISAYPCPLALEPGSFRLFPELEPDVSADLVDESRWSIPPGALKAQAVGLCADPSLVVFPCYAAGAATRMSPVDARDALALLVGQALNLPALGGSAFRAVARLAASVPAYELVFSDLEAACSRLIALEAAL